MGHIARGTYCFMIYMAYCIIIFQSFLANEDIGDSLEGVEALITKHENFEKTLAAQEEKFKVDY